MADSSRIEELRRRVQSDPASIAFAALAEEYRRAGRFEEAIAACVTGLQRHPSYLSAHVTLGRSLLEVGRYEEAQDELEHVLKLAPENLAAIRGLADIHHRRGDVTPGVQGAASETARPASAPQAAPPVPVRPAAIPDLPLRPPPRISAAASPAVFESTAARGRAPEPQPVHTISESVVPAGPEHSTPVPAASEPSVPVPAAPHSPAAVAPDLVVPVTAAPVPAAPEPVASAPEPPAPAAPELAALEEFLSAILRARADRSAAR